MSIIFDDNNKPIPYVKITEQPASRGTRFRYECEGRFAGAVFGENSTTFKKSFPTIEILNYKGPAYIVISCVSKDPPYFTHPHKIGVKTNEISNGICYFKTTSEEMTVTFKNLGIQCVKRKDIKKSLITRKSFKIDPFNTGFSHMLSPESIDLCSLRLCFQIFIEGKEKGNFNIPLEPVVSNPIYDKKAKVRPVINFMSHDSASVAGGTEMCILCEKAAKEDIQVRFFREENNWEAIAELTPPGVFKLVSIVFKSPQYFQQDINEPIDVRIQLRRISDGEFSESMPFQFIPLKSSQNYSFQLNDYKVLKRKKAHDATIAKHIQLEAAKNDWIKELVETIDRNDSVPTHKTNNYKIINKVANESETNFLFMNSNMPELLDIENTDNFLDIIARQKNNYQVTSASENLSKYFSISNLIKISTNITKDFNNPYNVSEAVNLNINKSTEVTAQTSITSPDRTNKYEKVDQCQISEFDNYYLLNQRKERIYNRKPQDLVFKHQEMENIKHLNLRNIEKLHDFSIINRKSNKILTLTENSVTFNQPRSTVLQLNNNINTFRPVKNIV